MPAADTERTGCLCNGIRFCALCRSTERVQRIFEGDVALKPAASVISNQQMDDRTSSCSFALLNPSEFSLCVDCGRVFKLPVITKCSDHAGYTVAPLDLRGVHVLRDFVSADEEAELVAFFDSPTSPFQEWKASLSGRRKHEFGPRKNFKRKKVKPADVAAMPIALKPVLERVSAETEKLTGTSYRIAEASVLEYMESSLSNIDPHVDDTWIWGPRIGGLNLLENCSMTFVNKDGVPVEAFLPRRSYFLMSGDSRYVWMHGIRPENVRNRRVSITVRELSEEIKMDAEAAESILLAASTYI